jgi:hypothetical protein
VSTLSPFPVRVRWGKKTENFGNVDSARDWATTRPGSLLDKWNGARWVPVANFH